MLNDINSAFLVPIGSGSEDINGISHLFEHLLIDQLISLYGQNKIFGKTTEDYIIIFCEKMELSEFFKGQQNLRFKEDIIKREKEIILNELKYKAQSENEGFFRLIWKNTPYEKSPTGKSKDIIRISANDLENLKEKVLKMELLGYSSKKGIEYLNNFEKEASAKNFNVQKVKRVVFKGKKYQVFHFENIADELYLLKAVLEILNKKKHIQVSEKKKKSTFIVEQGTCFPGVKELKKLKGKAINKISDQVNEIKENFCEMAWNELESFFFHRKTWEKRINNLLKTGDNTLLRVLSEIQHYSSISKT